MSDAAPALCKVLIEGTPAAAGQPQRDAAVYPRALWRVWRRPRAWKPALDVGLTDLSYTCTHW